MGNAYRNLVGKCKAKRSLRRRRRKGEDNIKMNFEDTMIGLIWLRIY
jgi:hypothetical protein